jgi:hypothetical protein
MKAVAGILIFFSLTGFSQDVHPIVKDFFAEQRDETVYLQWTIKEGQTCNDIYIERSENNVHFERIGLIAGVCGSSDADVVYSYTDSIPIPNQINYYRLEMGTQGFTSVLSINTHITGQKPFRILGNPVKTQLKIIFDSAGTKTLTIFGVSGKKMMSKEFSGKEASVDIEGLPSGIYLFNYTEGNSVNSGKFVVAD